MNIHSQIYHNKIKSYAIVSLFIVLMSTFFWVMGQFLGNPSSYFLIGIIFSLGSGVFSYYYSDKIVLTMAGARKATKKEFFDYYTVTENIALAAGLPMPALYVIEDPAPNAFATGRNPDHAAVAATTGLLHRLDRAEIEGVIAHELAHIQNYDTLVMTIVTVLVGTIAYAADFAMRSLWWGGGRDNDNNSKGNALMAVLFVALLIIMPIISTLIQLAVSRRREFLADASGALLTRNPDALADALEKIAHDPHKLHNASGATAHLYIENPLKSGGTRNFIARLFSTHPPVEERVKILRDM